jgi:hypothetical protein
MVVCFSLVSCHMQDTIKRVTMCRKIRAQVGHFWREYCRVDAIKADGGWLPLIGIGILLVWLPLEDITSAIPAPQPSALLSQLRPKQT